MQQATFKSSPKPEDVLVEDLTLLAIHKAPRPTTFDRLKERGEHVNAILTSDGAYSWKDSARRDACRDIDRVMSLLGQVVPGIVHELGESDPVIPFADSAFKLGLEFIHGPGDDPMPAQAALRSVEAALRERLAFGNSSDLHGAGKEIPQGMRRIKLTGPFTVTELPLWLSIEGFLPAVKALGLMNEQRLLNDPPELLVGTVNGRWRVLGLLGFNTTTDRVNKAWKRWISAVPEEELKARSWLSPSFADVHSQWKPPHTTAVDLGLQ